MRITVLEKLKKLLCYTSSASIGKCYGHNSKLILIRKNPSIEAKKPGEMTTGKNPFIEAKKPGEMTIADLEMFMEKLKRLVFDSDSISSGNNPFIEAKKPEIRLLYEELGYLIGICFKGNTIDEEHLQGLEDYVGTLKERLIETAQEAEDIIDMFLSSAFIKNDVTIQNEHRAGKEIVTLFFPSADVGLLELAPFVKLDCYLTRVMDDLKAIRKEIMINNNLVKQQDLMMGNKTGTSSRNKTANFSETAHEEVIVGFDEDALSIIDTLTGHRKKLDVISIVGMGGLGKTTLATKIYNDALIRYHFHMCGWITVSQAYSKRDMLVLLLGSIGRSVDEEASESKLYEMLYKSLKGRRYLIVIDDIWSCKAWDDVGICFPDDNTGSRVLITTRLTNVASHATRGGFIHNLGHLTENQSWELLCRKTFRGYECPENLTETGKHIAKRCQGLPLALVVIAGLLEKGEKSKFLWEEIAESVGSYVISDPKGCLDTLALSYDHLPSHLKKCFLYVGCFPEDYNIQVRRLIRLWIAEGFVIQESDQRSLEEEGKHYLMDLVDRNLLIVADKSSNGGIKSCRLHDLLRELCLKKVDEEDFFKKVSLSTSNRNPYPYSVSRLVNHRRLITDDDLLSKIYFHKFATHTRSVLCFREKYNGSTSWVPSFLLLRVLDLLNIPMFEFSKIKMLVHLRYLAVWLLRHESSFSEANFWSLETLIIRGKFQCFVYSPDHMVNLRHLRCDKINIPIHFSDPMLCNLQTVSRVILDHKTLLLLESFLDIKKLGCSVSSTSSNRGLLSFAMLSRLETLNIDIPMRESVTLANSIRFPETLKKLTLKGLSLPWNFMSTIQQLPKLEVLKLLGASFCGDMWETGDEQFHQLKYLKLSGLNIRVWEVSSINFPCLRKLVVKGCEDLEEIPLELGNIYTLEYIETDYSNTDVHESVYKILEAQREMGNYDIHVNFTRW